VAPPGTEATGKRGCSAAWRGPEGCAIGARLRAKWFRWMCAWDGPGASRVCCPPPPRGPPACAEPPWPPLVPDSVCCGPGSLNAGALLGVSERGVPPGWMRAKRIPLDACVGWPWREPGVPPPSSTRGPPACCKPHLAPAWTTDSALAQGAQTLSPRPGTFFRL
jgi:hypothetical protein